METVTDGEYQGLVELLGRRFEAIEQRLAAMDQHFNEVYRRFERLEQEYYAITHTLRRIERTLDGG